jgi:hypothetical protein
MGVVEDSGYLSRAAFLMDALMSRFGLDGRSFVMLLMGFGCNVPALMGTRVIRSRGLRLLTMLIIPFSLCSARMQVFVFFIAALFTAQAAPLVLFSLYVASILAAMLTSLLFKRQYVNNDPFIIEMPPYRLPTLRQIIVRGTAEVGHFLKRATRFIVAGVVLVWILTNFPQGVVAGGADTWAGQIGALLDPLLSPLGIDPKLTIALIFGFVAKEMLRLKKTNPMPRNRDRRYVTDYECAIWFTKENAKWVFNRQDEKYQRPEFIHSIDKGLHPTQKSLKLMQELVKIHSNEGQTVLDCFMGSGTTGVACVNLNRKFIGIEKDEGYFKVSQERIQKAQEEKT